MDSLEQYKPNSNKYKEEKALVEKKKVEKVVTGKVMMKKEGFFSKMFKGFISEDAKDVKSYVFMDVLIPAMKKAISDIVTDGIDIILYGESRGKRGRSTAERVSYRSYYDRNDSYRRPVANYNTFAFNNVVLQSRGEGEEVLARMDELIDTYGVASVADLNDLIGISGDYTDNKYGWTNVKAGEVMRVRDGYIIKMPRAVPID